MEKIIQIDGRDICFRATAAIPRLYRIKFGRDIMQDMKDIQQAVEKAQNGEEPIPVKLLEVFENVAYLMARHAAADMPEHSVEEWLDGFDTFSIYEVFPELMELWRANNTTLVDSKKNEPDRPGNDNCAVPSADGAVGHTYPGLGFAYHWNGDRYAGRGSQ